MLEDRDYMRQPAYKEPLLTLTIWLLLLNAACFAVKWMISISNPNSINFVQHYLALSLEGLKQGFVWQFLTYQFLHVGFWHLLFNCLAIFFFGRSVETIVGGPRFLALYFSSGIIGGVVQMLFALGSPQHFGGSVVGASAGASGLVAAFAVLSWQERFTLLIYFIPVNMTGRTLFWASVALAVVGILSGMITPGSHIANAAHLGGILTGFLYVRHIIQGRWSGWEFPSRRREPRELAAAGKGKKFYGSNAAEGDEEFSTDEFLKNEVDPILEKISAKGLQSLTAREREILETARRKINRH
jgi:membrane associated rhomboid family serine protease